MTLTRRTERPIVPLRTAIQKLMGDRPYVPADEPASADKS